MTNQLIAQNPIYVAFEPLLGLPCWGVHWEAALNLSMNFGQPYLNVREPYRSAARLVRVRQRAASRRVTVRGPWWLWIHGASWKLSLRELDPVTGTASSRRIQQALAFLDGQQLKTVEVSAAAGATRFSFDLGGLLEVRRLGPRKKIDMWILYTPDEYALTVRGDGQFSYEATTAPDHWKPIPAANELHIAKA